ncbi:hypothetical protein [Lysobacter sp. Root983]|uniref:hypothetical protein n=1 Tax=Lysobacter sp. Root983 TaxID=1736613 RepID=UPI00070E88B3|nr:hypothetical protein [Lysobacter sp. Root983]KRD73437.1 hypothetical protein ASE43_18795 [Lysobacter sp. Root983]
MSLAFVVVAVALHVLSSLFWAGTTFALSRSGGLGLDALRRPQMAAATAAILSGIALWALLHRGGDGRAEHVLATGAAAALIAALIQFGLLRGGRALRGQRVAAGLLAVAALCMAVARYV